MKIYRTITGNVNLCFVNQCFISKMINFGLNCSILKYVLVFLKQHKHSLITNSGLFGLNTLHLGQKSHLGQKTKI